MSSAERVKSLSCPSCCCGLIHGCFLRVHYLRCCRSGSPSSCSQARTAFWPSWSRSETNWPRKSLGLVVCGASPHAFWDFGCTEKFYYNYKMLNIAKKVGFDVPWDGTDKCFAVLLKHWLILTGKKYLHPSRELPGVVLNLNQLWISCHKFRI